MPWTEVPPLTHPRAALAAATCNAPAPGSGSRVYAIGGFDANSAVATVEAYDTAQKTWSTMPPMPTARYGPAAASRGPLLHTLGGWDPTFTPCKAHEVYYPATNSWSSQAAPLPTGRGAFGAVTGPDGLVYVIGGQDPNNAFLATVEAYDPGANTWIPKAPMQTPRRALGAVAGSDGLIYAIGGGGPQGTLASVEVFNIATNTWTLSPHPLPEAVCMLGAAVGANGIIYAIGGYTSASEFSADVYSYDPTAPGWSKRPPLPIGRSSLAAATGPDGLIYAIGGVASDSGGVLGDVEAYAFDKCDYIEYEIGVVSNELSDELNNLDAPELDAQQREAVLKQLNGLRAELKNLEAQLKTCQGG